MKEAGSNTVRFALWEKVKGEVKEKLRELKGSELKNLSCQLYRETATAFRQLLDLCQQSINVKQDDQPE